MKGERKGGEERENGIRGRRDEKLKNQREKKNRKVRGDSE